MNPRIAAPWLVLALTSPACAARAPDPAPMHPPGVDELDDAPARDSQASTETGSEAGDGAAPQYSETAAETGSDADGAPPHGSEATAESSSDTGGAPPRDSETVAETGSEGSDTGGAASPSEHELAQRCTVARPRAHQPGVRRPSAPMHPPGLDELDSAPARDSEATAETGSDADGARACGGAPLTVTFYDAGQALAAGGPRDAPRRPPRPRGRRREPEPTWLRAAVPRRQPARPRGARTGPQRRPHRSPVE